jgi:hypothetical protein
MNDDPILEVSRWTRQAHERAVAKAADLQRGELFDCVGPWMRFGIEESAALVALALLLSVIAVWTVILG